MSNEKTIDIKDIDVFRELADAMAGEGSDDFLNSFEVLLSMSDENFELIAANQVQAFQQSLNNPNDKLILTQALNAAGSTADELISSFAALTAELDKSTTLSIIKKDFVKQIIASLVNAINDTEGISKRLVQVPIELCHPDAKMPQYANISDSGMDVYALEDYTIDPGETKLIPTGIKVALPPGYELQVRPKSGRALNTKLRIANSPGTVDAGYRDEIKIIIENIEPAIVDIDYTFSDTGQPIISSILHGKGFYIEKGQKFAQLVLMEVPKAAFFEVKNVQEIGEDRGGGFGSTGLK